jgi:sigma-B regulation protein RsbU (phosphoserine phosphatase)
MARFAFWVLAYGLALWVVERLAGGVRAAMWVLFWIALLIAGGYYVGRLIGFVRARVLWRLRRRLIVTYVFIAVVPVVLIIVLVLIKDFLNNGQFAAFLVALKLRDHAGQLEQISRVVGHEMHLSQAKSPDALLDEVENFFEKELGRHTKSYPGLEITLRLGPRVRAFRLDGTRVSPPVELPPWLTQEEFAGFVVDRDQIALRSVDRGPTPAGELTVIVSQPLTPELLDLVGEGIGPVRILIPPSVSGRQEARSAPPAGQRALGEFSQQDSLSSRSVELPPPTNPVDTTIVGASSLDPIVWGGAAEHRLAEPVLVVVTSRAGTLNRQLLSTLGRFSRVYITLFIIVALVFLVIELVSLVIGVRLTRSITSTVDNLYDATERVRIGDFSYRIGIPARDQLTALGEAFDSMTASVERLLRESQEKSRLESELEIAREVQRQLFPQKIPQVPGLELYGMCRPARVVSGDYFDFLEIDKTHVGLVIADISGKGISAALLMAAIQSSLRAQLYDGFSRAGLSAPVPISTAEVVGRLNRQLFESTSAEKYATFFYALYDAATRSLTYTNAGHLPPVLFRGGRVLRLDRGGTVVGLFSPAEYEQAVVVLEAGDVFLGFTDGLTEPENIFGEEFGEARLLDAARRALPGSPDALVQEIYRSVNDWTGSPELQDDMTLLVAKAGASEKTLP